MVNTFLVCSDFAESASKLDSQRLLKQCVEAKQIIENIRAFKKGKWTGFQNHPASVQWRDHLDALKLYFNLHLATYKKRRNEEGKSFKSDKLVEYKIPDPKEILLPSFVHCPHYWYSHRAALYRKMKWYYKDKFTVPKVYKKHGYFWPSKIKSSIPTNHLYYDVLQTSPVSTSASSGNSPLEGKSAPSSERKSPSKGKSPTEGKLPVKDKPFDLDAFLEKHCDPPMAKKKRCNGVTKKGEDCMAAASKVLDGLRLCGTHYNSELKNV